MNKNLDQNEKQILLLQKKKEKKKKTNFDLSIEKRALWGESEGFYSFYREDSLKIGHKEDLFNK